MARITIAWWSGTRTVVTIQRRSGLAIHRPRGHICPVLNGWVITHIKSGLSVMTDYSWTLKDARSALAVLLRAKIDWTLPESKMSRDAVNDARDAAWGAIRRLHGRERFRRTG